MLCHQLGNEATRVIQDPSRFDSAVAAWDHRVGMGQRGPQMSGVMSRFGRQRGLQMFADWTDRIATGEVPDAPPRPQGVERNLVITMWDWTLPKVGYVHDEVATDKRDPRVNANGPIYGVDLGNDYLVMVDPEQHTEARLKIPVRDPETPPMFPGQGFPVSDQHGAEPMNVNPRTLTTPCWTETGVCG